LLEAGNTQRGSITVRWTSCLTSLEMFFVLGALNFVLHRCTFPNQSNRRSIVQWYFPFKWSLLEETFNFQAFFIKSLESQMYSRGSRTWLLLI